MIYNSQIKQINKDHIAQIEKQIVQAKKDYLKTAVNRTILEIDLLKSQYTKNKTINNDSIKHLIKESIKKHIEGIILKDSVYIWVNRIINYEGGDNYAVREIHPNLTETEGQFLSTNTTDIKGDKPYLKELQGINQYGELYFTYWFNEFKSDKISQKLSYAKLYHEFDWVVAAGIYLNDIEKLIEQESKQNDLLGDKRNKLSLILIGFTLILTILIAALYNKRLVRIFNFYIKEVENREKTLEDINNSLEQVIQKRTHELTESENRYQAIFKNNQSIMLLIDPLDGMIKDANNAAIKYYGYSYTDITSMKISEINILSPKELEKAIHAAVKNNSSYFIFKHKLANGEIRDVEVYSEKMLLNGSNLLFSIVHDISELKKTKQELIIAKRKAEESDQLKTAFLANMSHEIRTPLNSILGFSDLLSGSNNSTKQITLYNNIINNSGEQLLRIIDDIIDISHIESNQLKISMSHVSVNHLLHEITNSFRRSVMHNSENQVELLLNIPDSDKDYTIQTDTIRFTQICNNLLGNAFKFTTKGYIEIGYVANKSFLEFYVKDTGCGIPKNQQEIIFDRFTQVTHQEYREGNGLGLSITKGLIHLLGGEIHLKSEVNLGSTFYFTLPNSVIQNKSKVEKISEN